MSQEEEEGPTTVDCPDAAVGCIVAWGGCASESRLPGAQQAPIASLSGAGSLRRQDSRSTFKLKPIKPAIQISDADRRRKILITVKCTMTFKKWRDKGESRPCGSMGPLWHCEQHHTAAARPAGPHTLRCIAGRCL